LEGLAARAAWRWMEQSPLWSGQQRWMGARAQPAAVRHFSGLELTDVRLTTPWLERLATGLYASRLRHLRLSLSKVGQQKPLGEALARGRDFGGLRSLEVPEDVSEGAVAGLAAGPRVGGPGRVARRGVRERV